MENVTRTLVAELGIGREKTHFGSVTDLCRGLGLDFGNTEEQKGKKIWTELY